eukprot:1160977-Pelagomonas_calceolata.AAC.5
MPLPPSSRYAASPPATAPVPSRSSTARLMSPLLPPQHPQSGAAGAPKTADQKNQHTPHEPPAGSTAPPFRGSRAT